VGHIARMEQMRSTARPGRKWEDNIKMNFKEIYCEGMNWIYLAQERCNRGLL